MANNRVYLRCQGCGETLFLGKSCLSGYHYEDYENKPLKEKLNDFFEKHNYCQNTKADITAYDEEAFPLPDDMGGLDGAFDIVYENNLS